MDGASSSTLSPTRCREWMGGRGSWGVGKSHVTCCLQAMTRLLHTWAHWFVHRSGSDHRGKWCWHIKVLWRREESDAVLHLPVFTLTSEWKEAACQKAPALSGKPQYIWMSSKDTTGWVPDTLEFAQPLQCFRQCMETQSLVLCCLCFCEGFCYFCLLSIQNIVIAFAKYFTVTYSDLLVCDLFLTRHSQTGTRRQRAAETSSKCCPESSVVAASSSRKSLHFVGC